MRTASEVLAAILDCYDGYNLMDEAILGEFVWSLMPAIRRVVEQDRRRASAVEYVGEEGSS